MGGAYYTGGYTVREPQKPDTFLPLPDPPATLEFKNYMFNQRYASEDELQRPSPARVVKTEPSPLLWMGEAYDGLPLLLSIRRSISVKDNVCSTIGLSFHDLPPQLKLPLQQLEENIQVCSCRSGVVEGHFEVEDEEAQLKARKAKTLFPGKGKEVEQNEEDEETGKTPIYAFSVESYYCSSASIDRFFSSTFLSKVFGDSSESCLLEDGMFYEEHFLDKVTSTFLGIAIPEPEENEGRCRVMGVKKITPPGQSPYSKLVPLLLESRVWEVLPSTLFKSAALDQRGNSISHSFYKGLLSDRDLYYRALDMSGGMELLIDRQELLEKVIVRLAEECQEMMHDINYVHGDVKPANVLFVDGKPKLIDARGTPSGHISAPYTPAWCPPEQKLGQAVEATADVYALAMMVLKVVKGEQYGEMKNFKVPGNSSTVTVLHSDGVWIDRKAKLNEQTREAWSTALQRWLSFDPKQRPRNGRAFAEEVRELIEEFPLSEMEPISIPVNFGTASLHRVNKDGDIPFWSDSLGVECSVAPAWVITDTYCHLHS